VLERSSVSFRTGKLSVDISFALSEAMGSLPNTKVFISGGAVAYTGAILSPILGLMERITIGRFLQWLFVIALKLYTLQTTEASAAMEPRHRVLVWT
jgi:hypothetical protein